MAKRRRGPNILVRLLILLIILSTVVGAALISPPKRAAKIATEAFTNKFLDRPGAFSEHRLRVLEIELDQATINEGDTEAPSESWLPLVLKDKGIDHKGEFRSVASLGPAHHLGEKRSMMIRLSADNPYRPLQQFLLLNPESLNMVQDQMANWIAASMGVAVPFHELVFIRLNGEDYGVMELIEWVDGQYETNRNFSINEVSVLRGGPSPGAKIAPPAFNPLWQDPQHWTSNADSQGEASQKLAKLIGLLAAQSAGALDTLPISLKDTIDSFIDTDSYLRFLACLKVLNTSGVDNYRNQVLVLNGQGKFYPVLWRSGMMDDISTDHWYPINDALSYHILSIGSFRAKRDRLVYSALRNLELDSAFHFQLRKYQDELRPSMLTDPNKIASITNDPFDVFPFSSVNAARSSDQLQESTSAYWQSLLEQCEIKEFQSSSNDSLWTYSWAGNAALRLDLGPDSMVKPMVRNSIRKFDVTSTDGRWICELVPSVTQRGAEKPYHYSDRTYFNVGDAKFNLSISNIEQDPIPINAITNGQIKTK